MSFLYRTWEGNPLVNALGLAAGRLAAANLDVHAEDEMLLHYLNLHGGNRDQALVLYFDSGRRIWETVAAILRWRFGELPPGFQLLDFASGYGRVTRWAVLDVPPQGLWVSDVYAGGVRFQEEAFGVHGIVSHADPERLVCPETFDAIAVSSLFTHLPEVTFRSWLRRLWGLLRPGGVLAFTVHDRDLLPPGRELPPGGLLFDAQSESGSLPTAQYGTTWVDEAFVRRMVSEVAPGSSVARVPRGMLRFQDLYVVVPEGGADFSGLGLRAEPEGFVEHCSLAGGHLTLAGWVVDRARHAPPREVRLSVGDATVLVQSAFTPRPEVAVLFPFEKVAACGFKLEAVPLPAGAEAASPLVALDVVDAEGGVSRLYEDALPAALLRSARLDSYALETQARKLRQEGDALRARIAGMEASRFWKLRNAWFRVKRSLGLTRET
ncbi:MAG TPA: class I SAM-dependent methyltransferase [Thermoanaerobaculia bacterium]|nr:class I SAM-dependent methyltransferase [Thermoanaerobaculia bacterium]